jgi:hypothetical protein
LLVSAIPVDLQGPDQSNAVAERRAFRGRAPVCHTFVIYVTISADLVDQAMIALIGRKMCGMWLEHHSRPQ